MPEHRVKQRYATRTALAGVSLVADAFMFSDAPVPGLPDSTERYGRALPDYSTSSNSAVGMSRRE